MATFTKVRKPRMFAETGFRDRDSQNVTGSRTVFAHFFAGFENPNNGPKAESCQSYRSPRL